MTYQMKITNQRACSIPGLICIVLPCFTSSMFEVSQRGQKEWLNEMQMELFIGKGKAAGKWIEKGNQP